MTSEDANLPGKNHLETLQKFFGHGQFRLKQWEIISNILTGGHDQLAVMATGSGKSLCYQFPAVHLSSLSVVVSPLISLMEDQVLALQLSGIPACLLGSAQTRSAAVRQQLREGQYRLLYVSPEYTVENMDFLKDLASSVGITLVAIDEAHCVSQWGHDFRSSYRRLDVLRAELPGVPLLALTATATSDVRKDIIRSLKLRNCRTVVTSFDRPNLYLEVRPKSSSALGDITSLMQRVGGQWRFDGATIIYCPTRKVTEVINTALLNAHIPCVMYHAGMSLGARKEAHEKFVRDKVSIIVATVAFGMGIDKPDVRRIVHYGASRDVESYYQEIGRAGRDGQKAFCTCFFKPADFLVHRHFLGNLSSATYTQHRLDMLNGFEALLSGSACRRRALLRHFDSDVTVGDQRGCCDNCDSKYKRTANLDAPAADDGHNFAPQAALLLGALRLMNGRSGLSTPILFLRGSSSKKVWEWLKTKEGYGKGKDYSETFWKSLGKMLTFEKYIGERGGGAMRGRGGAMRGRGGGAPSFVTTVYVTPKGEEFLKAWEQDPSTRLDLVPTEDMRGAQKKPHHADFAALDGRSGGQQVLPDGAPSGRPVCGVLLEPPPDPAELKYRGMLYTELLSLRSRLSDQLGVMPYMVASNRTLLELAQRRPISVRQLARVEGITDVKAHKYGYEIVELINNMAVKYNLSTNNFPTQPSAEPENTDPDAEEALLLRLSETQRESYLLVQRRGLSVEQSAEERQLKPSTVVAHLCEAIRLGLPVELSKLDVDSAMVDTVYRVVRGPDIGSDISRLAPIKERCPDAVGWDQLKVCLAVICRMHGPAGDKEATVAPPQPKPEPAAADSGWLSSARSAAATTIVPARRLDASQPLLTRPLGTEETPLASVPGPLAAPALSSASAAVATPATTVRPSGGLIEVIDPFGDDSDPDEAEVAAAERLAMEELEKERKASRLVLPQVEHKFRWSTAGDKDAAEEEEDGAGKAAESSRPLWGSLDPAEVNARPATGSQSSQRSGPRNTGGRPSQATRVRPGRLLSSGSESDGEEAPAPSSGVKRKLPSWLTGAQPQPAAKTGKKRSLFSK